MKAVRFAMAVLAVLGITLACLRHAHLLPAWARASGAAREKVLRDDFVWRLRCVTLSGGFSRWVLGRRRCNEVYLAPNDRLVRMAPREDKRPFVDGVLGCVRELEKEGVRFLYVQTPGFESLDGRGFPPEFGPTYAAENCEEVLAGLRPAMRTVDLRPVVSATAEDVRENFLKTDHHWNFEGAFKAYVHLVPIMLSEMGEGSADVNFQLDRANWQILDIARDGVRFLGSRGRRTGPWFAGRDRLLPLVPAFPTSLRVSIRDTRGMSRETSGDLSRALIDRSALREPPTWNEDNRYNVYLGDQARVEVVSELAPVKRTVLLVKDSFSQPLIALMSSVFGRIVAFDPRYDKGRFVDEVRAERPDLVVIAISTCRADYWQNGGQK